jgi:hypothetical protein
VAQQFDVLHADRYQAKIVEGQLVTYCNIYASDVMQAMFAGPAHWVNLETGADAPVGKGAELRLRSDHEASFVGWLRKWGPSRQWRQSAWEEAELNADLGRPTLVTYDAPAGRTGHVAVLLPGGLIAQAGKVNLWRANIRNGFGSYSEQLEYWIHP